GNKVVEHAAIEAFERVMNTVRVIRNARSEFNVEPARRIAAVIVAGEHTASLESQRAVLSSLARLDSSQLQIVPNLATKPEQAYSAVLDSDIQIYLPLAGMIDLEKERKRLTAELDRARADATHTQARLDSDFATRAPSEVVQRERERLAATRQRITKLEEQLAELK